MTEEMHKALSELFDKGYEVGYKKAKDDFDRPHGELITVCTLPVIQKCSNCKVVRKGGVEVYNFCPNCGADMRKEGDEK